MSRPGWRLVRCGCYVIYSVGSWGQDPGRIRFKEAENGESKGAPLVRGRIRFKGGGGPTSGATDPGLWCASGALPGAGPFPGPGAVAPGSGFPYACVGMNVSKGAADNTVLL